MIVMIYQSKTRSYTIVFLYERLKVIILICLPFHIQKKPIYAVKEVFFYEGKNIITFNLSYRNTIVYDRVFD